MSEIIAGLLAIWILGLGMTIIAQQHKWYWNTSRHVARAAFRTLITNPLRKFCKAHQIPIRWFLIGAVTATILLFRFFGAP